MIPVTHLIKSQTLPSPEEMDSGHGLPRYNEDPYWLDMIELGQKVADGFETEDYDAIIWRALAQRSMEEMS